LAEGLEIGLSRSQQQQAVGGNGHRGLRLNAVGITHLSFPDT
jgi:hypothetical protein